MAFFFSYIIYSQKTPSIRTAFPNIFSEIFLLTRKILLTLQVVFGNINN